MFCTCCASEDVATTVEPVGVAVLDDEFQEVNPALLQSPPPPLPQEEEAKKEEYPKPAEEEYPKPAVPPAPVKATEEPKHYYYEASLSKGDALLGLELDFKQSGLNVERITEGSAAEKYNASVEFAKKIQVLDFIVGVNGHTDNEAMLKSMQHDRSLTLRMFRPAPVSIKVDKGEAGLGLGLRFAEDSENIDVEEVINGAAKAHNAKAPPESQIRAGDVILSVNGISREVAKMVEEIKTATELNLVIIRVPAPGHLV